MALPFLIGLAYLNRNPATFPKLTLHAIVSNGQHHSNFTYESSEKTSFKSDIVYDELILKCTAATVIKWVFQESPMYNSNIKYINIFTERKTTNLSLNIFNFTSFLHIKFKPLDRYAYFNGSIGCQHVMSLSNTTWFEIGGSVNYADWKKGISTFKIYRGSKVNNFPKKPGENKNCRTSLIIDEKNYLLGCKWKPAGNADTEYAKNLILRDVANVNEMDVLITLKSHCAVMPKVYEKYMGPAATSTSTKSITSAAVMSCGYGANMLSVPIFRWNSKLYFEFSESEAVRQSDLIVRLPKNASIVRDSPHQFKCEGSYSIFVKGFFWISKKANHPYTELGNGVDFIDKNNQVVSKKMITFTTDGEYMVHCLGFIWNSSNTYAQANVLVDVSITDNDNDNILPYTEDFEFGDRIDSNRRENHTISEEQQTIPDTVSDTKNGIIIIIVAISSSLLVVIVCCAILLWIAFRKIRKQSKQLQLLTEEEIAEFEKGNPKAETALFLPYNMEFEIQREKLYIGNEILGEGNFGQVQRGRYGSLPVAVKTVKKSADSLYFKSLLSELKIMSYVGRHINIVHLVGACTKDIRKGYVCLVYELCANGNMQQFLKASRKTFGSRSAKVRTLDPPRDHRKSRYRSWIEPESTSAESLTIKDLVLWSQQIASGMEYLSSKNIIHGDLAARNVLITDKMHAKLGDFGLSKQLFEYSIYIQKQHCPLPLKWMAPESLRDMEFSIQSDIWSYGITLWEIFSLGELPYPGVDWNYESWKMLCDGFRMERPRHASPVMFKIILECWKKEPKERPTFTFLQEFFGEELQQLLLMSNNVFDKLWM